MLAAGRVAGYITSAAEDPGTGTFLAFAWLDADSAAMGIGVEVAHLDRRLPATIDRSPLN